MSRDKNLLMDVWLVSLLANRLVEGVVRDSPVSVDEFALYGLVVDLGPVTASQLARWTGLPRTSLSAMIRRCEERGELERSPNPADRRSQLVRLTEHGFEVYRSLVEPFIGTLGELREALAAREGEVRGALQHLDAALRALLSVADRPYRVDEEGRGGSLAYAGERLTRRQAREAVAYLDWVRHRDRGGDPSRAGTRRASDSGGP